MKLRRHPFWIAGGISLCCLATTSPTLAQIVPDATLPNSSIVTPQGNTSLIEGGTQAGNNLFHSFEQFSIPTGSAAYFNNAIKIQNIISRVTGGSVSNIDGLLRANGTANLFLLNPNGIIFGPNASLNIGGSFLGSTASAVNFADGTQFSATAHPTTPLLTISVPLGLQYGGNAGSILNQSQANNSSGEPVGLQVQPGKTLALVGGNVRLDGGNLQAAGGRVELGAVAGAGTVGLNIDSNNLSLNFPNGVARADVSLTNGAFVNVTAGGGGSITINARNIALDNNSILFSGINESLGSVFSKAGDITLNATGLISIANSFIASIANSSIPRTNEELTTVGVGNGGDINIRTGSLSLSNGAQLIASTFGQGDAGSVNINARDTVSFDGVGINGFSSGAFSNVSDGAVGNGGNINITTGSLALTSGAGLFAYTRGQGNAGSVNINARDTVSFDGVGINGFYTSGVFSSVNYGAVGNGGNINIMTGSLSVTNGAGLSASSEGSGGAGDIQVAARSILLDNQALLSADTTAGQGGNIILDSQNLVLRRGSNITTNATGTATGGNIAIDTGDTGVLTTLEDSDISANASEGSGGQVIINAQGIFGTEFREVNTTESDITATSELGSQFSGTVEINTPDINPSLGLVNLPAEPVNAEVAQGCQAGGGQASSEFVNTGRGGLPPSPNEALSSDAVVVNLITPAQLAEIPPSPPKSTNSTSPTPDTIVEAQGWAIGSKGEVVLTATAPTQPITLGLPSTDQLVQQGKTLYEAEQFSESAAVWRQAAAAFKASGDELRQATTLSNLSLAYQQLGQWPQATEAITESLNLLQTGGNIAKSKERASFRGASLTQLLAQTLDIQGRLQLAQGQAYSALTTWMAAADTYAQIDDKAGVTRSRINSAQALQALGLYRQAQKTLTESTQLLQNQPDSLLKATGLRSLGNVLRVVGDLKQSRQVLEQSLEVAKRSQSPQAISDALLSLGNTARLAQDTQAALKFYQQAATASASHSTRIQAQLNQLSLLLDTKQLNAAKALLPQIHSQIATLPPSRTAVYARINFAQSLMKLGSRELLAGTSRVVGAGFTDRLGGKQKIQVNPPSLEQGRRGGFYRQTWGETENSSKPALFGALEQADHPITPSPYHPITPSSVAQLLTTALQQAKNLGDQRATSYALGNLGELYEQTQQWSDAEKLTQQALFVAQAIDAKDIAYRWQWQLGRLLRNQGNIQGAIAAYTEAVNNIKSLRSDLVAINPEVQFDFRDEVEPVYRQLVDLLLQPPSAGVSSQKNLQQARELIESLQLAELENFLQCSLQDAKGVQIDEVVNQDNQTAAVIYPIILEDRLEVILKLPQQPLRHYTTLVPQSEVENILEQLRQNLELPYTFQEVSSLSQRVYDWLIKPVEADLAQNGVETLVFVLDGSLRNIPIAALYDGKHYLIEKYGVALTPSLQLLDPKPLERTQLKTLTAGLTPAREVLGQYFPPLPTVERELDLIKSEVPSVTLLNQEFTTQALQKQINNRPFSVVHLATHAQFSSNPDQTFILAWDKLINVKELDKLLQSRNQSRLDPIELLVLSACETADGDKRAALGLAGIAVRAGARSTLASLWAVENASVADFMGQFYQVLANPTVNKAEALRRAQLVLLQQPQYRHPFYWAPYILLGNWL